jgi:cytoskeleton protein RodZ
MADHSHQTVELFSQIGARLKAAREARGYTLRELSSHTRINLGFLEKIEAGDLSGLPGIAFVKGFIRNYISVLEIQDAELDEALQHLGPTTAREQAAELKPSNPMVLDTQAPRPAYLKMGLFAVLAILILWVGYALFRGSSPPEPVVRQAPPAAPAAPSDATAAPQPGSPGGVVAPPAPAAPMTPGSPTPAVVPPRTGGPGASSAVAPPQGRAQPRAAGPGAPARVAGAADGRQKLELTMRGLERTWVRMSIDRAPPIDVLLQPAETVAWNAEQEIRLTIGRSNGVAVYLNGEEIVLPSEPNRLIPSLVLNKLTLLRLEN